MFQRRGFLAACGGIATLGALLPRAPAWAADEANMGALANNNLLAVQGPWRGFYQQGFYVMENKDGFNSARISTLPEMEGITHVSVDVFPSGTAAYSGAGLVLNQVVKTGAYLAVALQPNGQIGIYSSPANEPMERLTELPAAGLRSDAVTRLSLENSPSGIVILTNGEVCGHFSDIKLKGSFGIMAIDRGTFYFANFTLG